MKHDPLDGHRGDRRERHERGEARERQPAGVEGQQVGEVGDRQQQRGRVGQVRARIDVRLGTRAHPRRRGEDDRRKQHDGRVEAEHRGDRRGDREDEGQQPSRASPRATSHDRPHGLEQPLAPAAIGDQKQRREEAHRRREAAQRVARL